MLEPSEKLALLYRAQIDCLAVDTLDEAIGFFLESARVLFDLQLAQMVPDDLRMSIVVRPWLSIPLRAEWRAFMYGGKLRGISQYFTDLYFPELVPKRELIRNRILDFFEKEVLFRFTFDCHRCSS